MAKIATTLLKPFHLAFLLLSCYTSIAQSSHAVFCIKLSQQLPMINRQGKVDTFIPYTNRVFYYNHLVMVQVEYGFDSSVNNKLIKSETRYRYLVFSKGSTIGNLYDEGEKNETRNVKVDSILKLQWFTNINLYEIFKRNNLALISSVKDRKAGTMKEEYSIVAKTDTGQKGTCYLYFTRQFKNIDFSLSPELDSIKGMKLDSVRIVNNARFYKEANVWLDRIEQYYKMEEDTVFDKPKILEYFKKYGNL